MRDALEFHREPDTMAASIIRETEAKGSLEFKTSLGNVSIHYLEKKKRTNLEGLYMYMC